jgi:glycosyltransferase involved in cell wall biosynthesis
MLQRHPGIVVLHDFFLSNVIDNLDRFGGAPNALREALFHSHGYTGLSDQIQLGHNEAIWKYPANKAVLDHATGVIVHSPFAVELAETFYGQGSTGHWRTMPLLRGVPDGLSGRTSARAQLGLHDDELLICSFGMLGSTKLNNELLDAFLALPAGGRRCRLVYVGGEDTTEYGKAFEARVRASERGDAIAITGFVTAELYSTYLQAADIAVQLRGMTRGETSASVLDCLLYDVATIVNANGSNAALPRDIVCMLPDRFTQPELNTALALLCANDAERQRYALAGGEHVRRYHAPEPVGLQFAEAIETFTQRSTHAHYQALLRGMREIGAPFDPRHHELVAAAKAIAANQPPVSPRQLFVDISAVAQSDLKTGIQRVVRSILLALIKNPPPGYRIEPVYGDGGNRRYRYARQFTLAMLGISGMEVEDAPIEHRAGDVFLGLDLVANITAQNQAVLEDMRNHGIQVFFVVYDILPLLLPSAFPYGTEGYFREFIEVIARVSDGIVCISRAVADELLEWIGVHVAPRASTLEVGYFHLGADISSSAPSTGLPDNAAQVMAAIAQSPTLLMVGTVEPRKGHEQALAAFELLWSQGVDVNLVIVGKPGWMVDSLIKRLENHPHLHRRLFWLSGASDEMLTKLYDSCSALLAASIGEGFGLPLIEAAQHGLPIVARNLPVFREVSGEHAFYFEGMQAEDLAEALRAWLALFGTGQAPQSAQMPWLTWADSAQQLLSSVISAQRYRNLPGIIS